ncbi:MAG: Smr/MutS family protein [Gammaproteobacteria bacterium]
MAKKPTISQEDLNAFHDAMKGTKPLSNQNKVTPTPPKPKVKRRFNDKLEEEKHTFHLSEGEYLDEVDGEELLSYKQPGIDEKILRNLRKGQYNVQAKLDLHGMTANEARLAIEQFIHACLTEQIRSVLIIHGKGHTNKAPILKNKLNHWLREIKMVLAFCSAATPHGNSGATYVLLKRIKEEKHT